MTKAQGRRSQKLKVYYERQYAKTSANKARRAAKRARRKVKAKQPNDQRSATGLADGTNNTAAK